MGQMVSIIIPVYNVENYLEKCIESVINQDYSNLQIILVDDGSIDKSGKICDKYANRDSRIEVVHKKNGGLSAARNTGLELANGDFIAFVDSDDYISKNMYADMIAAADKYGADVVRCGIKGVYLDDNPKNLEVCRTYTELSLDEMLQGLIQRKKKLVVWNAIYRHSFIAGMRFVPNVVYEDVFWTREVLMKKHLEVYTPTEHYRYLQSRPGNTNTASFVEEKRLPVVAEFLAWNKELEDIANHKTINMFKLYTMNFMVELMYLAYAADKKNAMVVINEAYKTLYATAQLEGIDESLMKEFKLFKFSPQMYCMKREIRAILRNIMKKG